MANYSVCLSKARLGRNPSKNQQRRDNMKQKRTVILTVILMLCFALPVQAANAKATTLRLEKTEGTVKVEGKSGKAVSLFEGMKLYSGYSVGTGVKSYAYLSLDESKAVKLDASSKAEVRKSGKQIELHLISGELLCDVTAPLKKDETLNIRTSTMVTGIRGTALYLRALENGTTEIFVLDGKVTVTAKDPITGETKQVIITAGQKATSVLSSGQEEGPVDILVEGFTEDDIPGYVATEIKDNDELRVQIAEGGSGLDVDLISENADKKISADWEKQQEEQQNLENQLRNRVMNSPVPLFVQHTRSHSGSSSTPVDNTPPAPTSTTLDANGTVNDLIEAFQTYDEITITGNTSNLLIQQPFTIPEGKTLTLEGSMLSVNAGAFLTINGTLNLNSGSQITNAGTIINTSNNSLNIKGMLSNSGTITNTGTIHVLETGQIRNNNEEFGSCVGTIDNSNGTINVTGTAALKNYGNFDQMGTLICNGTYYDDYDCYTITSTGLVNYRGSLNAISESNPITSGGKLVLLKEGGILEVPIPDISVAFTIDLRGFCLNLGTTALNVTGTGTLNITDTNLDAGEIKSYCEAGTIISNGNLNIQRVSVSIEGKPSAAIALNNGSFSMTGGEITALGDNSFGVKVLNGAFIMEGGTISAEGYASTGIQLEGDNAESTMTGGEITALGDNSFGVKVLNGAFIMEGGTISAEGSASTGIQLEGNNANLTMNGGEITALGVDGFGVKVMSGFFVMNDGTISAQGSASTGIGYTREDPVQYQRNGGTLTANAQMEARQTAFIELP
jgi:hypothetical protein